MGYLFGCLLFVWSCVSWRGGFAFLFVWLACGVGLVAVVCRSHSIHLCLHTQDVKLSLVFSETGARPCSGDSMSLVRFVVVSPSVLDCLYARDPPQPVRKKRLRLL